MFFLSVDSPYWRLCLFFAFPLSSGPFARGFFSMPISVGTSKWFAVLPFTFFFCFETSLPPPRLFYTLQQAFTIAPTSRLLILCAGTTLTPPPCSSPLPATRPFVYAQNFSTHVAAPSHISFTVTWTSPPPVARPFPFSFPTTPLLAVHRAPAESSTCFSFRRDRTCLSPPTLSPRFPPTPGRMLFLFRFQAPDT